MLLATNEAGDESDANDGSDMANQRVRDVMTKDPVTLPPTATLAQAAQEMSTRDIGDVLVVDNGKIRSVLTDRDIVVRAVAQGLDPMQTPVSEAASNASVTVGPDEPVDTAVRLMREHKVRRLPVVEQDRVVGIVSLGDLAAERDPDSVLADISQAPPNN